MSSQLSFTKHASKRLQQRGLRENDLDLIINVGTVVDDEGILLLGRDVDREVRKLKRTINALERLRGCKIVIADENAVITAYRPSKRNIKRMMRRTNRRRQG